MRLLHHLWILKRLLSSETTAMEACLSEEVIMLAAQQGISMGIRLLVVSPAD